MYVILKTSISFVAVLQFKLLVPSSGFVDLDFEEKNERNEEDDAEIEEQPKVLKNILRFTGGNVSID